jgi:hypothetical protein
MLPMLFEAFQPPWPFCRAAGFVGLKGCERMSRDERLWGPSTTRYKPVSPEKSARRSG